ncbi:hypothetical protein HELRODRAFT_193988 [Helobdella robusta]|uniref:Uncharacterized protein n=1 Tax=Helobdella robusta TaxID=6412 RepID=T1FVJ7_HELRO|nr:hypothetical protein HELRODRAFT_193988 [Helobdella robusta]ESN93609.1 hypothetical protein HELRODRAFT_193988 [Helobdella robusta]
MSVPAVQLRNCTFKTDSCGICPASEYRTTYIRKEIEPVKSCKPEVGASLACEPISNQTTNRVDFVKHPLDQPNRHVPDPYHPPDNPFEGCTVYKAEYTRKPINPSKQTERNLKRMCLPPFEGQTSNKMFEKAKVIRDYHPNTDPFDGATIYKTNYVRHISSHRKSKKPDISATLSTEPLDTSTEHRDQFIRHPLPEKSVGIKEEYHPLSCPIDDKTVYRTEFIRKEIEMVASCKPDVKPSVALEPIDDKTTNRTDFIRWPLQAAYKHKAEPYVPIEGQMTCDTTHKLEYTRKPIEVVKVVPKREKLKCILAPFNANTTYKTEFQRWDASRPHKHISPAYIPISDPFCGITSYRNDFIRKGWAARKSKKPNVAAYLACAPLECCTEYKNEFTRKEPEPCVAGLIEAGIDTDHQFVQQDAACHKWYQ